MPARTDGGGWQQAWGKHKGGGGKESELAAGVLTPPHVTITAHYRLSWVPLCPGDRIQLLGYVP